MKTFELVLPIKLISEANIGVSFTNPRFTHALKKKRKESQQIILRTYWNKDPPNIFPPCDIHITRIAPRSLDYDNMVFSCKNLVDSIADLIKPGYTRGRADGQGDLKFYYYQEHGGVREYNVKIELIWDDGTQN